MISYQMYDPKVYLYGHCEPLSRKQVFIDLEEMMGGN